MYLGMVLLVAGASLLTACPWNLWTALGFAVWLQVRFILPEERFLGGLFGERYAAYMLGRGRWFI
jgi:protein-S-isoprenylcysteine O-methyltransferase Ste14